MTMTGNDVNEVTPKPDDNNSGNDDEEQRRDDSDMK